MVLSLLSLSPSGGGRWWGLHAVEQVPPPPPPPASGLGPLSPGVEGGRDQRWQSFLTGVDLLEL